MAALRNANKILQKVLMKDIANLQWSCVSEKAFVLAFNLLEEKYTSSGKYSQHLALLQDFFVYFREKCGQGH